MPSAQTPAQTRLAPRLLVSDSLPSSRLISMRERDLSNRAGLISCDRQGACESEVHRIAFYSASYQ